MEHTYSMKVEGYLEHNVQILTYVEVDMECYLTVNVIMTDAERRSI